MRKIINCRKALNLLPVLFVITISLAMVGCSKSASIVGQRPNFILVITDDQGYGDLGCHGHPYLKTPNLDKLYTQSTRLTDFHASPTCSPTRAALMTGNLPFKNGVTHTILERERMALSSYTIAQALQNAGYRTGIFGKWHLGDEDAYQPGQRGFDEVFIHGGGGIGQKYIGSCADAPDNSYFDPVIRYNGSFVKTKGFCTDVFFRQALAWVKTSKETGQPFFAYITTNAPHAPFHCPDPYKPYLEQHTDNAKRVGFYGMIHNIDDNMGLLMAKLDEWALSENTLLIFMSDNGSAMGDFPAGMKGQKGSIDEGGSRVPSFWRWPGTLKAGQDIDTMLRHVDYFPTLAAIAGAEIPPDLDGRSMVPLLEDPGSDWEDRNTFFHTGRWLKPGGPDRLGIAPPDPDAHKYEGFAVRNARWRLVGRDELYDIQADPGQTTNVIEQHPEVASQMLSTYEAWWDKVRPMMVNEDAPLSDHNPFIQAFHQQQEKSGIPEWMPPIL